MRRWAKELVGSVHSGMSREAFILPRILCSNTLLQGHPEYLVVCVCVWGGLSAAVVFNLLKAETV